QRLPGCRRRNEHATTAEIWTEHLRLQRSPSLGWPCSRTQFCRDDRTQVKARGCPSAKRLESCCNACVMGSVDEAVGVEDVFPLHRCHDLVDAFDAETPQCPRPLDQLPTECNQIEGEFYSLAFGRCSKGGLCL